MKIAPFLEIGENTWNEFCFKSDTAWFRHTSHFLKYSNKLDFEQRSKNISFAVYHDSKMVAVVPLILQPIQSNQNLWEFAMGSSEIPYPALSNGLQESVSENLIKFIFQEVDCLAMKYQVSYCRFFVDALSDKVLFGKQKINPLPAFGFNVIDLSTNIINLNISEEEIMRGFKKGHRMDIRSAINSDLLVDIYDSSNITKKNFLIYQKMHFCAAGRKTRPDVTWDIMFDFIIQGFSFLALIKDGNDYIGGNLFSVYKKKANYASAATLPEYKKKRGLGNLLQWEAIKYLKKGCNFYETGWNYYPNISDDVHTIKELNIGSFKRHFGGEQYPVFRGEKFYSKEYLKQKRELLTQKFIDCYSPKLF